MYSLSNVTIDNYNNVYPYSSHVMATSEQRVAQLRLSEEQLAAYQKKFNTFDLNKDGVITMREFAAVSKVFGYKLSKEEILVRYSPRWLLHITVAKQSCIEMTV